MKALITGASSGIGRDMAIYLADKGYELILVGRNKNALERLQQELKVTVKIIVLDLSNESRVKELYILTKSDNIDILINNAGFGSLGEFDKLELSNDLEMIDTNIKAVHILTKLVLKDMKKKNSGYILNVASSASFQPGPLMATYYATKAYVLHLTEAIYEELRRDNSNIVISCLCPGPVKTNFNNVAGCTFKVKALESSVVAKYAIDQMLKKKLLIIPGVKIRLAHFCIRFLSIKRLLKITYNIQEKKQVNR